MNAKTTKTREDDESYAKAATTPGNVESSHEFVKVLGVTWNTVTDELLFHFSNCTSMEEHFWKQRDQFSS